MSISLSVFGRTIAQNILANIVKYSYYIFVLNSSQYKMERTSRSDIKAVDNLFGLKFVYESLRATDDEKLGTIIPAKSTDQIVDYSAMKCRSKKRPLEMEPEFERALADYEEKLNEYYDKYSPIISRRAFTDAIVSKLQSNNSQSELADLIGLEAMEFIEYVIENRNSILLNSRVEKKCNVATYFGKEEELWEGIEKRWRGRRKTVKKNLTEKGNLS